MTAIDVRCEPGDGGWTCLVRLADAGGSGEHRVTVRRSDLARLAPGADDPVDLVRRSFAFLLERESRDSILRAFDLTVIGRYFPEWERDHPRGLTVVADAPGRQAGWSQRSAMQQSGGCRVPHDDEGQDPSRR